MGACLNELSYARFKGKQILPLMVEKCQPPLSISRIQWLDLQHWDASADHEKRKLAQIREVLDVLQRWSELETLLTDLRFLEFVFRVDAGVTLLDEYTCLEKRLKAVPTGMADSKSGLAKLSALARFAVRAEFQNRPICRRVPFFCIQQAFNSAPGPLREMAQLLLAEVPVWFERLAPIYEQSLAHETLGGTPAVAISADGRLAAVARGSEFELCDIPARTLCTARGGVKGAHSERITAIAITPCGPNARRRKSGW